MKSYLSNIKLQHTAKLILIIAGIILIASSASLLRVRIDLTEDRRFTLSKPTKDILSKVKDDIYIQVYLDGEIPVPLKRLKRSVADILEEFRVASGRRIDYVFINPAKESNAEKRNAFYQSLNRKGLESIRLFAGDDEGGSSRKLIFPGMIVNYNGIEVPVNFLKNDPSVPYEQNILHSQESLEYEIIQTIATLSADTVYKVAFIEGHGEEPEIETADITISLARFFTVDRGTISGRVGALDDYAAIVIAGPQGEFSEADKFVIDQYIMKGGRVLWLIDEVYVSSDSLVHGETAALYRPLNLEDQLFRYGARINPVIVQDLDCQVIRLKVVGKDGRQQLVPAHWVYNPLLAPSSKHPVTRNINKVIGEFVNTIDTVGLDQSISKKILLATSRYSRTLNPPMMVSLKEAELMPDERQFSKSSLPVAVLLEGKFTSAFKNRMIENIPGIKNSLTLSRATRMIVVADGDIIRNEVSRSGAGETPMPLGRDRYTGMVYGNKDFLVNSLNYLVDDKGLMELRSREMKIRLLNASIVKTEKLKWQLINILAPVLLVIVAGAIYGYLRKLKYSGR